MQIRRLPINDLKPAPYNPRVRLAPGDKAYERLARSLDELDLVQPLIWNERTGYVVGGHQRLEILRRRGVTELDCVVVNLSDEKERALNVTLNNASVAGDWDPGKLVDLLDDLQSLPDFDPTLTGFDEQELRNLVLSPCEDLPEETSELIDSGDDEYMRVLLEIPHNVWPRVQARLDALIAEEP